MTPPGTGSRHQSGPVYPIPYLSTGEIFWLPAVAKVSELIDSGTPSQCTKPWVKAYLERASP